MARANRYVYVLSNFSKIDNWPIYFFSLYKFFRLLLKCSGVWHALRPRVRTEPTTVTLEATRLCQCATTASLRNKKNVFKEKYFAISQFWWTVKISLFLIIIQIENERFSKFSETVV